MQTDMAPKSLDKNIIKTEWRTGLSWSMSGKNSESETLTFSKTVANLEERKEKR